MIVCPRCSKENQDHYKFCLGCGAELPRDAEQPKSFSAPTPPGGTPVMPGPPAAAPPPAAAAPPPAAAAAPPAPAGPPPAAPSFGGPPPAVASPAAAPPAPVAPPAPAGGPPPAAAPAPAAAPPAPVGGPPPAAGPPAAGGAKIDCPKCGASNNQGFKFCGTCGHPLDDAPSAGGAPAAAPPAAAPAPAAAPSGGGPVGTLVLIRPDGTEGESINFTHDSIIGRETTPQFASDSYLSPRHACFMFSNNTLTVRDEGSLNGIYLRVEREEPTELVDGQIFRIGQEIIRFEKIPKPQPGADGIATMGSPAEGLIGRICLVTGRETNGNCYAVSEEGLHLGRERGDILFPDDGYVSGLHARIHLEGGKVYLTDVGSSNGTFIRVDTSDTVNNGQMLLLGQQLFRVEW